MFGPCVFLFVFPHWADAGSKFIGPLGLDWRSDLVVGYGGEGLHYLLYRPVNGEEKKKEKRSKVTMLQVKVRGAIGTSNRSRASRHHRSEMIGAPRGQRALVSTGSGVTGQRSHGAGQRSHGTGQRLVDKG